MVQLEVLNADAEGRREERPSSRVWSSETISACSYFVIGVNVNTYTLFVVTQGLYTFGGTAMRISRKGRDRRITVNLRLA